MKTVLGSLVTEGAYRRYAKHLAGRIPDRRSDFSWGKHAELLFEAYKRGEIDFALSDLDPNAELRGPREGSSAWTFSHADAGDATGSPALLQKRLAVHEEYAAGYLIVEISAETAVAHGAAKPTAIDLTNNTMGKLNAHPEPFGRTHPTQHGQKQVRELVLAPIPISQTEAMSYVKASR